MMRPREEFDNANCYIIAEMMLNAGANVNGKDGVRVVSCVLLHSMGASYYVLTFAVVLELLTVYIDVPTV